MSLADLLSTLIGTAILGGIVVAANVADRQHRSWLRRSVVAVLFLFNILILFAFGLTPLIAASSDTDTTYQVEKVKLLGGVVNPTDIREVTRLEESTAAGAFALAFVVAGLATAVLFRPFRQAIAFLFPRRNRGEVEPPIAIAPPPAFIPEPLSQPENSTPLFPQMLNYYTQESMVLPSPTNMAYRPSVPIPNTPPDWGRGFNPDSTVHMVALSFIIYLIGTQFVDFILGGGLEGVAQGLSGITALDIVIGDLPLVLIPLLGVGIGIRRNWRQTFDRLGLRLPTGEGLGVAVGMTIALLIFVAVASAVWQQFVSQETLDDQTEASEALASNVDTIFMAFVLAAAAAVAEELAFRGAMQPVFGFWPTALVFAMIHLQYTLTPASLMILVVAIAFGWIRRRYSTTVAMMTHFLYNFIPLALLVAVDEQAFVWLIHLL